jgi:hypothetical protein
MLIFEIIFRRVLVNSSNCYLSKKMNSKSNVAQKNMVPSVLVFFCDVLCMKNICHACSIEKLGCVVQVFFIVDICYFC